MAFDAARFLLGIPAGTPQVFLVAETRVTITGTPVEDGVVGEAYDGFSVTGHDGRTPYVYSVAADPDGVFAEGLALDASTGAVSGTPAVAEVFTGIVLRVTDANGFRTDLAPFDLEIGLPPAPEGFAYVLDGPDGTDFVVKSGGYVIKEIA